MYMYKKNTHKKTNILEKDKVVSKLDKINECFRECLYIVRMQKVKKLNLKLEMMNT